MENLSSRVDSVSESIKKEKSVPIIYIAGKYRGNGTKTSHYANIMAAEEAAYNLSTFGFGYFCPHSNGALSTLVANKFSKDEDYPSFQVEDRHALNMSICRRLIMSCDAVLMLNGWEDSEGATEEKELAETLGIPVYYSIQEVKDAFKNYFSYPKQFNLMRALQCIGFQLHREKNLDYSPYNIKATGGVGLVTRIWDKCMRIIKLTGIDIGTGEYKEPQKPRNESLIDTSIDLSNYSIFYTILYKKLWGE